MGNTVSTSKCKGKYSMQEQLPRKVWSPLPDVKEIIVSENKKEAKINVQEQL
jgi:hypothetical protein